MKPWSRTKARARVLSPDQRWGLEIARRILADCHPWQRDAVIDPSKRITELVGRGGAKTTSLRARAMIKLVLLPNEYVGYAATSKEQARDLNWDPLKRMCEAYGLNMTGRNPDVTFLDTRMQMRCTRTGTTYNLRGVEDKRDAEKFRGFAQAEFQVDECGSFSPDLLEYLVDECVSPRLGQALAFPPGLLDLLADEDVDLDEIDFEPERGGIITLASSPPKRTGGMFYDLTRPGSDKHRPYSERAKTPDWDGYSSHSWNLKDVVTLPEAERRYPALVALRAAQLREFARKGWDEDHPIRKREYDGIWSEDNTTHVFRFREDVNTWDPFAGRPLEGMEALKIAIAALPKDVWHFILAIDSGGTRDPFAINLFAFAPADAQRRMFHVFGIEKMGLYARTIAEILIGPEPEKHPGISSGGILSVAGWPDAIELDGDEPTIQELKNVYGIQCRKSDRRADYKFGAVELVNGDLGAEKIFVLKKSPLAVQMRDLQWKADEYGILRENKAQANHSTDTLLYARRALSMLFESGAVATEEAQPAYVDPMGLGGGEERDPYSDMLTEAEWSEA